MAATRSKEPIMGLTFEKVWASLMELRDEHEKNAREMKDTFRQMKEEREETARIVKDNARQMGYLNNRFGELAEHLVGPGIVDKFNEMGFSFTGWSDGQKIFDPVSRKILAEVDMLLENGDIVIAVEIKVKPKVEEVNEHIERMEVLRKSADRRGDKRKFRGAIAAAIINKAMQDYVIKKGFYLIVQSGDTMKITIPEGFKPREW